MTGAIKLSSKMLERASTTFSSDKIASLPTLTISYYSPSDYALKYASGLEFLGSIRAAGRCVFSRFDFMMLVSGTM